MTTLLIINEDRKRREFLYHLYRRVTGHNYFGWSDGTFANSVYKDMEQNWGRSGIMPILRYHFSEGNVYCKGYSEIDCQNILENWDSLESYKRFPSLHITHKGMMVVETDHELLKCVVNDGAAVDWSLADGQVQGAATSEQHRITPEQVDSIIFSAIVGHGYTPQNVGEKYAVLNGGHVLGYIWAARNDIRGRYFLYQQGDYVPRQPQDGVQRTDEDTVHFMRLIHMIQEKIKEQAEVNEMVLRNAQETAASGQMKDTFSKIMEDTAAVRAAARELWGGRDITNDEQSGTADASGLEWVPKRPGAVKRAKATYKIVQEMHDEYDSDLKDPPKMQELVDRVKNKTQTNISEKHLRRIIKWHEAGCPPN